MNILIGKLTEAKYCKPVLLKVLQVNKLNGDLLAQLITFEISAILTGFTKYSNFKTFITNAASYCIKAGKTLKARFPELKHAPCLTHAVHSLAETIRSKFPAINNCVTLFTKKFIHSNNLKKELKNALKIKISLFPVLTRWET